MLRPIDAYTLNNALVSWYNDTEGETEKSILRRVMQMVVHAPTLTPPNEPLTCEGCACKEYSRDSYPCNSCFRNDETLSDQYRPPEGEA